MPRGNGTGPAGMGPMTGRAAGHCAGYNAPGYSNTYGGRPATGARFFDQGYPGTGRYPYITGLNFGSRFTGRRPFQSRGRSVGFGFGRSRAGFGRGSGRW